MNPRKIVSLLLIFWMCISNAQEIAYSGDPDASFLAARDLAFAGERQIARDTLRQILAVYPEYTDVRCLLAKTYSWDNEFEEARLQFNRITSEDKNNKDVWIGAIKNEQYAKNFHIALGLCNKALIYLEDDSELLNLKAQILEQIEAQQLLQNVLKETKIEDPTTQAITLYTQGEVFDEQLDPMYYGALEYKKEASWGVLIPRLNFNRRFNINGVQAEVDAYPRFNKTLSGYINYGYSASQIFPRHRIGGEVLKELPKAMEVSLGFRHLSFDTDDATILTGTFGIYRGNYYAVVRPYIIPDSRKGLGVSGNLLVRRYLKDGNNFLGMNLVYGFDTELNQFIVDGELLAETLLYLEAQRFRLEYQFSNGDGNNLYKANIGVNRQELAFSSGNFFLSVTAGLAYSIKFR
ncbi:YaiO family outer membrane beta-barrel protein [Maribacter aestuarii]|uniref:YaiO family outer membrane beta-barrel protein n=1 Tax=Maribacter aestuarii TaxID=1130723 RepID=UPI00248CB5F2|nr:YaiO family outer membrane beta-barrel protein [Maribacter aestuarii]